MNNLFFLAAPTSAEVSSYMNNGMTLAEKAADSLSMIVRGMGMVFVVLILLWGALSLFRVVFYDLPNKRKKAEKPEDNNAQQPAVQTIEPEPEPVIEESADDTELVAVIAAAVSAYTDKPLTSFRVVSFKRAGKGTEWNKN